MTLTVISIGISTTLVALVVLHRVWSIKPTRESKPSLSAQIYRLWTWNGNEDHHQIFREPDGEGILDGVATGKTEEPKGQNR